MSFTMSRVLIRTRSEQAKLVLQDASPYSGLVIHQMGELSRKTSCSLAKAIIDVNDLVATYQKDYMA